MHTIELNSKEEEEEECVRRRPASRLRRRGGGAREKRDRGASIFFGQRLFITQRRNSYGTSLSNPGPPAAGIVYPLWRKSEEGIGLNRDDVDPRRCFPLLRNCSSLLFWSVLVIWDHRQCRLSGRQVGDGEDSQARCDAA
jgi:hypothetical protein